MTVKQKPPQYAHVEVQKDGKTWSVYRRHGKRELLEGGFFSSFHAHAAAERLNGELADPRCLACRVYFTQFQCNAGAGECDCPPCQGLCSCDPIIR